LRTYRGAFVLVPVLAEAHEDSLDGELVHAHERGCDGVRHDEDEREGHEHRVKLVGATCSDVNDGDEGRYNNSTRCGKNRGAHALSLLPSSSLW
jgi:hypothetical protein